MKKYIDTFEERLLKENVSKSKFKEAFDSVKAYIDFTLKSDDVINKYVPNTHIAETFKNTLILLELEHLYPEDFKKMADSQKEYFVNVSILDIVLNEYNKKDLTTSEIERVYKLRCERDDFIRQQIKVIYTRMPDYALKNIRTLKSTQIKCL